MTRSVFRWRCFRLDLSFDMRNRLHLDLDDERRWVSIGFGNGYSDDVWSLQIGSRR